MGTVYLRQQHERIILRHYDMDVGDAVHEFIEDRLREDGLLDENGDYTPDGGEPKTTDDGTETY